MAELKTKSNNGNVTEFLNTIEDSKSKEDCKSIIEIMEKLTGEKPRMWGSSIVGFGIYHYKYASGHEGDWFKTGFSPRKRNLTLYIMSGFDEYENLLNRLVKYKNGKSCIYIKQIEDINLEILKELISASILMLDNRYGSN
jgi:hypothetical protein